MVCLDRGDLNTPKRGILGAPAREEDFTLDPTGNWTNYVLKGSGTPVVDQDRTHNKANEITQIEDSSVYVAHDRAGNMTKVPKPASWSEIYDLTYDPWNRLVKVEAGMSTVAEYAYLCSCQLAGAGFLGTVGRRSSRGTGRCSFSHSSIAA